MMPSKLFRLGWDYQKTEISSKSMPGLRNGSQLRVLQTRVSLPSSRWLMMTWATNLEASGQVHCAMEELTPTTWDRRTIRAHTQGLYLQVLYLRLQLLQLASGGLTTPNKWMLSEKESCLLMLKGSEEAHPSDHSHLTDTWCTCHLKIKLLRLLGTLQPSATTISIASSGKQESTWNTIKFSRSIRSSMKSLR